MKKAAFYLLAIILVVSFTACEDRIFDPVDETPVLKKGGKRPADVQQGDLYGDLIEVEIDERGVPVLYPLQYLTEFQDDVVEDTIDVQNPRLDGPFLLTFYVRSDEGYPELENGVPKMLTDSIDPGDDGFLEDPVVLYDLEGEILEEVPEHVIPVEQGRLNLIRSSTDVLPRRMAEVIKNFGNETVAAVIRDYCGRLFMVRTQDALDLGIEDKPIDSPLENMAIYKELMLYGLERPANEDGLQFLVESFNFRSRVDTEWNDGAKEYTGDYKSFIVMNLAASCIAAASDKSGELNLDEIILVNRFLGIPGPPENSEGEPGEPTSFFDTVTQKVRMLDKTNKTVYTKYRYYIDYSFFEYNRYKFEETLVDLYTFDNDAQKVILKEDLELGEILSGSTGTGLDDISDVVRYIEKDFELSKFKAIGFANQADDYVQALAVIHNNEEFLEWKMPTPTWSFNELEKLIESNLNPISRGSSPFIYVPEEDNEGGSGGGGNKGGNGGK